MAAGHLPTGPYEIPLAIQDRMFTRWAAPLPPSGRRPHEPPEVIRAARVLRRHHPRQRPGLAVPRRRAAAVPVPAAQRIGLALLHLFLSSGQPFHQIGTDDGLLEAPVSMDRLTIGPGERADVVVDFSAPALGLDDHPPEQRPRAVPEGRGRAIPVRSARSWRFKVTKPLERPATAHHAAGDLRPLHGPIVPLPAPVTTRQLLLFEGEDEYGRIAADARHGQGRRTRLGRPGHREPDAPRHRGLGESTTPPRTPTRSTSTGSRSRSSTARSSGPTRTSDGALLEHPLPRHTRSRPSRTRPAGRTRSRCSPAR